MPNVHIFVGKHAPMELSHGPCSCRLLVRSSFSTNCTTSSDHKPFKWLSSAEILAPRCCRNCAVLHPRGKAAVHRHKQQGPKVAQPAVNNQSPNKSAPTGLQPDTANRFPSRPILGLGSNPSGCFLDFTLPKRPERLAQLKVLQGGAICNHRTFPDFSNSLIFLKGPAFSKSNCCSSTPTPSTSARCKVTIPAHLQRVQEMQYPLVSFRSVFSALSEGGEFCPEVVTAFVKPRRACTFLNFARSSASLSTADSTVAVGLADVCHAPGTHVDPTHRFEETSVPSLWVISSAFI